MQSRMFERKFFLWAVGHCEFSRVDTVSTVLGLVFLGACLPYTVLGTLLENNIAQVGKYKVFEKQVYHSPHIRI